MVNKKAQKIIKGSISSLATVSILNIGSIYPNNILENEESNDKNTAVIEDKLTTSKKDDKDKINIKSENQFNLTNGQVINKSYQVIAAGNNLIMMEKTLVIIVLNQLMEMQSLFLKQLKLMFSLKIQLQLIMK